MKRKVKKYESLINREEGYLDVIKADLVSEKTKTEGAYEKQDFSRAEVGISSRVLNYWMEKDLLPKEAHKEPSKWKAFDLPGAVWVRALARMREFGLSIDKIQDVKQNIYIYDKNSESRILFEYHLALALKTKLDPHIVILPDGSSDIVAFEEVPILKDMQGDPHMMLISIKSLLKEFDFVTSMNHPLLRPLQGEINLLGAVRNGSKKVSAYMKKGKIDEISVTDVYSVKNRKAAEGEIKESGGFGSIGTSYGDGKAQSLKVEKIKRL